MRKEKNVGKPDEGKLHVRFDEEGQVCPCPLLYLPNVPGLLTSERPSDTSTWALGCGALTSRVNFTEPAS